MTEEAADIRGTWWLENMLGFDVETTDANPEEARIVQFATALVNASEKSVDARAELVNPGVPVPAEASAINGITTEMLEGAMSSEEAMAIIAASLWAAIEGGYPVVAYNGRYDLTVSDREFRRCGMESPAADPRLRVIDPRQLDLYLWRYRSGKRTLAHVCEVYNARLDGAHDATHDAIAAARLAYRIGQSGRVMLERPWDEVQKQRAEWDWARGSVDRLHVLQTEFAAKDAVRFEEYCRSRGDDGSDGNPPAVIDRQWPVIPFEERAPGAVEYELFRRQRNQAAAAEQAAKDAARAPVTPTAQDIAGTEAHSPGADSLPPIKRASDLVPEGAQQTAEELEAAKADLFSPERTRR